MLPIKWIDLIPSKTITVCSLEYINIFTIASQFIHQGILKSLGILREMLFSPTLLYVSQKTDGINSIP